MNVKITPDMQNWKNISQSKINLTLRRIWIFLLASFRHIMLFILLMLFASYQMTTPDKSNEYIDFHSTGFQNLIKDKLSSTANTYKLDTSQDINQQINNLTAKFYQIRKYRAVWTVNQTTNHNLRYYTSLLESTNYLGFPLDYFYKQKINSLKDELSNVETVLEKLEKRIELEIATTHSALKLMIYLHSGIIKKDTSESYFTFIETLPNILDKAINRNLINNILSVQPKLLQYRKLVSALPQLINTYESVEFHSPAFINDELLARSLYYVNVLEAPTFDTINNKSVALNRFQKKYSLPIDTILNNTGRKELIALLHYRYFQACLNLNRLRRLDNSNENYLFVNIPEFKLHVIEDNKEMDAFNIIVGKKRTPTPTLSSNIEKIIANPYWTVPKSIVNNEMIYRIRNDSMYLARNGYFIIDYRENTVDESIIDWSINNPLGNKYWVRQKNIRANALGQIKFIFPNDYRVYLHDTPVKKLFNKKNRTFSHGCIRLENPDKLAQYLSNKYLKNNLNIKKLISSRRRHVINLNNQIAIHIQYITCSGKTTGIKFHNDVYKMDQKKIKAMFSEQAEI